MSNPSESQTIIATDADFQQTVIDKSKEVPVLVDFWAPWCGPCKVIGPLLEKLADEMKGRFLLVKVNMDENPMLAQALNIQSIPTIKLIINAELRDEFMGAIPEPELRAFLEKNLPTPEDNQAVSGLALWFQGQKMEAVQAFQAILAGDPDNAAALIGSALYMLEQDEDREAVRKIVEKISTANLDDLPDKNLVEQAIGQSKALLFLLDNAEKNEKGNSAHAQLQDRLSEACKLALEASYEEALTGFLDIVKTDRKFQDDAGRLGMLAVFALLPHDSPLTQSYRQQLSSILFS